VTGKVREWVGNVDGHHGALRQADMQKHEENRRKDDSSLCSPTNSGYPLAPIASALEVIRSTKGDPTHLEPMSDIMARQIHHMKRLLDDLLDVSRIITRGVVELNRQPADLTVLAERSLQFHASGHRTKKSLTLKNRLHEGTRSRSLPMLRGWNK
jgi:hypothetical protein